MSTETDITTKKNNKKTVAKIPVEKVGKEHQKYIILLKLLNKILENIGREPINDITEFVNVDREDIIKDVNKVSLENMEGELFPLFNKMECGYYYRSPNWVLNVLRGLTKQTGYIFTYTQKDITTEFNGKNYRKTHTIYSIK